MKTFSSSSASGWARAVGAPCSIRSRQRSFGLVTAKTRHVLAPILIRGGVTIPVFMYSYAVHTHFYYFGVQMDCYRDNVFAKLSATTHGSWYSTLATGHCDGNGASACTWRVVSVDKIVQRSCHVRVFGAAVAATAPSCFKGCGNQSTNTSSPCWVDCFYRAALGPEAGTPGGKLGGMPTDALVAAWAKPFLPEAQGGCPAQEAWQAK